MCTEQTNVRNVQKGQLIYARDPKEEMMAFLKIPLIFLFASFGVTSLQNLRLSATHLRSAP